MFKNNENTFFCFTKFLLVIVFFVLFLLLMGDVWLKYLNKLTNTGIGFKPNDETKKTLPCITIRPTAAYKRHGFFYTKEDYEENTFKLEDIFHPETIERLNNTSLYTIENLNTLVYGKCHKLCYQNPVSSQQAERFILKKQSDYIIYTLGDEEEFWLVMPFRFPYEIALEYLDSRNDNGIISVNYIIQAIQTTVINRPSNPCNSYSKTESVSSDNVGFVECSRRSIWSRLEPNISCTIPGLEYFQNSTLKPCLTKEEGHRTRQTFYNLAYDFQEGPWKYGCPLPCERLKFSSTLQYYHNTSWIEVNQISILHIKQNWPIKICRFFSLDFFWIVERVKLACLDIKSISPILLNKI